WSHALTESRSRNRLALYALLYLQRDPLLSDYVSRNFGSIEADSAEHYNEVLQERYMQQADHYSNEVLAKLSWKHYVMLFHELQRDSDKPHVMVFDNLDWLSMTVIQERFITIALDILAELRRNGVPIKGVICVRDENVAYFHHNAGASFNLFQVLFSKDDYVIKGVADTHYLHTDEDDFSHRVLERRISLTRRMLSEKFPQDYAVFEHILQGFWMKNGSMRNELGHFRFGDLCNGSLRIMLGLVHDCTLDLMKRLDRKQLKHLPGSEHNAPYHTVRGSLICQLAHNRRTREIMKDFYQSLINEHRDAYCCMYRMILVLLDNHRTHNDHAYTFDNLQADLSYLFPSLSEADTRRYLKELYFCGEHHGELIVIYQQQLIRQPADIQPDALLQITGRGRVFLRTILIHYDFFKGVLAYKDDKRKPQHILFDMNPKQALERSQL
ncbi:MAG TPA: hypothetical protein PK858_09920, partial [Saprospiraceae bacterium]|nr:hypothetical protein [Saprospiraceae bacterium]